MTSTNPPTAETVIVVGGGLSGVAAALGVALQGGRAIILEASDLLGGAAAYSGGLVWCGANHVAAREGIEDNVAETETYVRAMAHASPELLDESGMYRYLDKAPVAMKYWEDNSAIRWHVIRGLADYHNECAGAAPEGRYLTNELIDGSELGDWREKMRVSPYFPVGTTYQELLSRGRRAAYVEDNDEVFDHPGAADSGTAEEIPDHAGNIAFGTTESRKAPTEKTTEGDPLTFGTGVFASFLNRAAKEPNIEFRLEHRVSELLVDAGRVVGVGADSPSGHVELRGPVILATSTYDWNPELVKEMLGLDPEDFGSVAPQSLRGDGITLARSIGANIAHLPPNVVPILPGWPSSHGTGYNYGPEYALPHSMIVDRTGKRYCDDSYWVDIVKKTLDPEDNHLPFFLIWDEQHHQSYGLGSDRTRHGVPRGSRVVRRDARGTRRQARHRRRPAGGHRGPLQRECPPGRRPRLGPRLERIHQDFHRGSRTTSRTPCWARSSRHRSGGSGSSSSAPGSGPAASTSTATGTCCARTARRFRACTQSVHVRP